MGCKPSNLTITRSLAFGAGPDEFSFILEGVRLSPSQRATFYHDHSLDIAHHVSIGANPDTIKVCFGSGESDWRISPSQLLSNGSYPLHVLAPRGCPDAITAFLELFAKPLPYDCHGFTPMHTLALSRNTWSVKSLGSFVEFYGSQCLFSEVSVKSLSSSSNTPLQTVRDVSQYIRQCTVTPLHWALLTGNLQMARALIDAGSLKAIVNGRMSVSMLHFAAFSGCTKKFSSPNGNSNDEDNEVSHLMLVHPLLKYLFSTFKSRKVSGLPIVDGYGRTPLHYFMASQSEVLDLSSLTVDCVEVSSNVIKKTRSSNISNKLVVISLICELFVSAGIDPYKTDHAGKTAFHYAPSSLSQNVIQHLGLRDGLLKTPRIISTQRPSARASAELMSPRDSDSGCCGCTIM
ncbi:hypothetical protein GEMRC1_003112 [Eukaryota sp. GEM-RC1]